jgi:glucosylceramidase
MIITPVRETFYITRQQLLIIQDVPAYPQAVLDGAGSFVNTVAWHCYAQNNDWAALTTFHEKNPNVVQYQTECWTSPTNSWYSTIDFVMG